MSRSRVEFNRWSAQEVSTWPYQMFIKYNLELGKFNLSHLTASKKVYKTLGSEKAEWGDECEKYFIFEPEKKAGVFKDIKDWSNAYNAFDNWVNLNNILAASSNFETYLTVVIKLALESDPGVIFGAPNIFDGVKLLKYPKPEKYNFDNQVIACTKGEWHSRAKAFEKIFFQVPKIISDNIGHLEAIRRLRNSVGHAIGRDIEASRIHGVKDILPMKRISKSRTAKYLTLLTSVAKEIDKQLLNEHIGEYQAIHFYDRIYHGLSMDLHPNQRAMFLKKGIGKLGAQPVSKFFCNGLVAYYEEL